MDSPKEFKLSRDQLAKMIFMCKVRRCSVCNRVKVALPDEDGSLTVREALRIKGILDNYEKESDFILFDSLRRLQLMDFSVETLKASEIGKSVNCLQEHGSKHIKNLARTLIEDWKVMLDECIQATAAITESTPESGKASVLRKRSRELSL